MNIWNKINQQLDNNSQLYLLTVIESSGSAPGRRGFMMLVDDKGGLYGSIGGGIMEYKLVEKAKKLLMSNQSTAFCVKQVHRGDVHASSGMICSGEQTIAFTALSRKHKELISACSDAKMIQISENGLKPLEDTEEEVCRIESENQWLYTQLLNKTTTIHLFGAGHVSVPTSELLNKLGYQVRLYDNRSEINTYNDNNWVYSKQVIDYADIKNNVKFRGNDFVVLMTHKFIEDKLILSQILATKCAYLGVLGSQNKIKVMFDALLKEGHKQAELDKVFAPIGLDIHSKTTTEIAVSIVAEIIKIKNA